MINNKNKEEIHPVESTSQNMEATRKAGQFDWAKKNWEFILAAILWFMIWATYNADIFRIFSPGFPHDFLDLVHGLRAFLPFIGIIIAIIFLLKRRNLPKNFFLTPLGLLSIYTIVGILSSVFSKNPLVALYWDILYGSVTIVLLAVLASSNPIKKLSFVINMNWIIAGVIAFGLFLLFIIQPGVISSLTYNFLICSQRPYESLAGANAQLLSMSTTRPTGLGRYAGIAAVVAFCWFLYASKKKRRIFYFLLFLIFLFILLYSKGKTEIIAFIAAFSFIVFKWKKLSIPLVVGLCFIIFISIPTILLNVPCSNTASNINKIIAKIESAGNGLAQPVSQPSIANKPVVEARPKIEFKTNFLLLSGRVYTWSAAWPLFLSNPLLGYGFQADRFFLQGQHAHNTILHALVQTGLLGTIPFVLAFVLTSLIFLRLFKNSQIDSKENFFLITLSAALVFFAVRSLMESVAFFSADWLFVAPIIAYIQCLDNKLNTNDNSKKSVLDFLGNKINIITLKGVVGKTSYWIKNEAQKLHWIIVTGMHGVVEAEKHASFKYIIGNADMFVPDGISLVWLAKLKGFNIKERVSGADLMQEFFDVAQKEGFSNYFYGNTEGTLKALNKKLLTDFPNLKIAGNYSPPFRELTEEEDQEIIQKINQAKPDVLWVALGLPKQEKWIFEHREKLKVPMVIGVGAALKFLSGEVKRVPKRIGDIGLEWLWRLFYEPKVVWKRVFVDVPIFLWLVILDFLKK